MAGIMFRIHFLIYNLASYIFYYFVPKNLRTYVLSSWYVNDRKPQQQQQQQQQQKNSEPFSSPSLGTPPSSHVARDMDADGLKKVFHIFDRNKDGMVTKDELIDSLTSMGIIVSDEELVCMMDKVDMDGDGCIDLDEFKALYQMIMDMSDDNDIETDMREAFGVFDQNRDGFITVDELKLVLECLGLRGGQETTEDCEKMIKRVDEDGDGMVNFAEFKEMMKWCERGLCTIH